MKAIPYRRALIALLWITAAVVRGQDTFLVHFDSVQTGHAGDALSIEQVSDGYLVFGSQYVDMMGGIQHVWVRKLDLQGHVVSEREIWSGDPRHIDMNTFIDPVCSDGSGGCVLTMIAYGWFSIADLDVRWCHFDENGDTLSTRSLYDLPTDTLQPDTIHIRISQTIAPTAGGYAMTGYQFTIDSGIPSGINALLIRTNAMGDTLWTRQYAEPGSGLEACWLADYFDHGFLITGAFSSGAGSPLDRNFLIRTDSGGNELWRRAYGGDGGGGAVVKTTTDSAIMTWSTYRDTAWAYNWYQLMLTKWDGTGDVIWQRKSHYAQQEFSLDMEVLPDGGFICSGWPSLLLVSGMLARFSATGDSLWTRYIEFHIGNSVFDVSPMADGGFLLCGRLYQDSAGAHPQMPTWWAARTDSLGCIVPGCSTLGVQHYEFGLIDRLTVSPNPTHEGIRFSLDLPEDYPVEGTVSAFLISSSGAVLIEKTLDTNGSIRQGTMDTGQLAPGIYFLHVKDDRRWLAGSKVVVQ